MVEGAVLDFKILENSDRIRDIEKRIEDYYKNFDENEGLLKYILNRKSWKIFSEDNEELNSLKAQLDLIQQEMSWWKLQFHRLLVQISPVIEFLKSKNNIGANNIAVFKDSNNNLHFKILLFGFSKGLDFPNLSKILTKFYSLDP